jgi:CBS domain containing-hemolysin-like protein
VSVAVGLLAVVLLVAANAFFVAVEFAIVAVDRTQVRVQADQGSRRAGVVAGMLEHLSFHLSGAQFGITIVSLGLGVLAEPVIAPLVAPGLEAVFGERSGVAWSVAVALLLTTVVQMVVGELVPKGIAVARPMATTMRLAPAMRIFDTVFRPVIAVCNAAAEQLLRLFGMEPAEELSAVRSREELQRLVRNAEAHGSMEPKQAELLDRAFRFGEKNAADAMTPRQQVEALAIPGTTGDLLDASRRTGLSRFPVFTGDIDGVEGVVHVKDVLGLPPERRRSEPLGSLIRRVLMVPETLGLDELMEALQAEAGQFAVVLDEFGSVAGIVTLEDLVEEIVGDIADEHDLVVAPTRRTWGGAYLLSGRLHPDEVRDECGLDLPVGEYDTLAGFVLAELGRIPAPGDGFEHQGWSVSVAVMDARRVDSVRLVAPVPGFEGSDDVRPARGSERTGDLP